MVDRISTGGGLNEASMLGVGAQQGAEKVSRTDAEKKAEKAAQQAAFVDNADISDAARQAADADKEVLRFSRMAMRQNEPVNNEKVATFKAMIDNGRINDYLSSLNTDALAASLLQSSSAAYLKAV